MTNSPRPKSEEPEAEQLDKSEEPALRIDIDADDQLENTPAALRGRPSVYLADDEER